MADKLDSTTLDLKPPVPRKKIGAFELQAILGQGGMGIVYRAVGRDGGPAAVKVLRTSLASPELVRRFEREAMIRIEHPNIIQVLDAGIDAEGTPYIAFELAVGETVETRIRRGSLSAAEAVTLGAQVCRGLAAAHAAGVIHRDLKPANLITLPDGTVKLLDFGIALLDTNETRMTNIGSVLGTPSYLSPEQASGNAEVDARTDIWSLGALLYEALSGRGPFDRETALATIVAVIMEEPIPLATRNPRVPPGLAAVIERALQKPRDRRFPSAAAFEAALLGADLTVAPPPTSADALHETQALMAPGENRVVAILLADGVVNLAGLRQAVEGRGGVLLPVIGGRAVGLFGGERWEGDELLRAAAAALEARGQTARMAVASGRAVRTGAALSGAVLKAAEAGCAAGLAGVAADPDTARRLKEAYSVVESRPGIWELQSARAAPRSVLTLSDGTAPPTLGREAELAQMQRALLTVEEGRALALLAVGPAGIGKSRLRMEMEKLLEAQAPPSHLLAARAEPYQRQVALGLFGAALKARARLGELVKGWPRLDASAPAAERQDAVFRLAREVIPNEASARGCAEFLGELVGVAMPETVALRAARSEPRLMADRLQVALQDYFAAAADRGPVALLLEDLQWADPASLDFLDDLLDRLRDVPVLVFATARPELAEARPDLFAGREVVKMEPRGLSGSDVATLARAIVGRPLPDALTRAVAERTAGNPLFVEQIVLELRDRELATTDLEDLPLPLTVEAAVQSRLDHLPAPEKELCKRAAVFGRPFVAEEVEALGVAGAAALLVSLGRRDLVGARARSRTGRAREYQFRSMLVADVAYRMLPDEVRAELHRQAAAYLGRQAEADLEEVASHHERGDQKELAAERYGAAALQAARRGDTQTVLRCVARALELGAPAEVRFPLHMARGDAYRFLGRRDEQAAELAAALAAARTAAERARVLVEQAVWMSRTGRTADALAAAEEATSAAREGEDHETLALARIWHGAALVYAGRLAEARAVLDDAAALATTAAPTTRAIAAEWRAQLASALGDLGEQRTAFRAAVELYAEAGDVRRAAGAECNLADIHNRFGAYGDAERALRAALDGCRRVGNRVMEGYALLNLGYSLAMLGRTAEAVTAIDEAAAVARQTRDARLGAAARVYRARAQLGAAPAPELAAEAEQAASEAEGVGLPGIRIAALVVAARARLAAGEVDAALALSTRALGLRDELGSVEEDEADVFLTQAAALRAAGRETDAVAVLARGRARVHEIAERIADPDGRARFLGDVPAHAKLFG